MGCSTALHQFAMVEVWTVVHHVHSGHQSYHNPRLLLSMAFLLLLFLLRKTLQKLVLLHAFILMPDRTHLHRIERVTLPRRMPHLPNFHPGATVQVVTNSDQQGQTRRRKLLLHNFRLGVSGQAVRDSDQSGQASPALRDSFIEAKESFQHRDQANRLSPALHDSLFEVWERLQHQGQARQIIPALRDLLSKARRPLQHQPGRLPEAAGRPDHQPSTFLSHPRCVIRMGHLGQVGRCSGCRPIHSRSLHAVAVQHRQTGDLHRCPGILPRDSKAKTHRPVSHQDMRSRAGILRGRARQELEQVLARCSG
mmetsp:Transcript_109345/g.193674  ORF Transcript_109345/g.193674 Transcript_109345/m.193674 type:complete len:309 (-) Transcript_109345:995-1921(-)